MHTRKSQTGTILSVSSTLPSVFGTKHFIDNCWKIKIGLSQSSFFSLNAERGIRSIGKILPNNFYRLTFLNSSITCNQRTSSMSWSSIFSSFHRPPKAIGYRL
jgi:hypothetical protein